MHGFFHDHRRHDDVPLGKEVLMTVYPMDKALLCTVLPELAQNDYRLRRLAQHSKGGYTSPVVHIEPVVNDVTVHIQLLEDSSVETCPDAHVLGHIQPTFPVIARFDYHTQPDCAELSVKEDLTLVTGVVVK